MSAIDGLYKLSIEETAARKILEDLLLMATLKPMFNNTPAGIYCQNMVWRSATGEVRNISDLHTSHMSNILRWLRSNSGQVLTRVREETGLKFNTVTALPVYLAIEEALKLKNTPEGILIEKGGMTPVDATRLIALLAGHGLTISVARTRPENNDTVNQEY